MIKKGFLTFLLISSLAFGALAQEKSVLSMEEALAIAQEQQEQVVQPITEE